MNSMLTRARVAAPTVRSRVQRRAQSSTIPQTQSPTMLTSIVGQGYPISQSLDVMNPGPQAYHNSAGRPTMSGGFAAGRVSGTCSRHFTHETAYKNYLQVLLHR